MPLLPQADQPARALYTEMVTTGAMMFGNVPRHLDFDPAEHPIALQLGGSDPQALAHCARLGEAWGYDEINLNVGCPSERVQTGSFGACLMAEPALVADCVAAMRDAVDLPVTVKHRTGIDAVDEYAFVRDFVGTVAAAGAGYVHRPRPERDPEGSVAEGESRDPAAASTNSCTG